MVPSLVVCVTSTCAHEPNDSVRRHGQRGFRRECGGHARRVEARRALSARAAGACFFSGLRTRVESARPRVPGRSEGGIVHVPRSTNQKEQCTRY